MLYRIVVAFEPFRHGEVIEIQEEMEPDFLKAYGRYVVQHGAAGASRDRSRGGPELLDESGDPAGTSDDVSDLEGRESEDSGFPL